MITGKQVRAARAANGWTRAQLGAAAGVDASTVQRIEIGTSGGLAETRAKLQRALETQGFTFAEEGERVSVAWTEMAS
jgi:transcriptional regulator with XRE-family HTH domain